MPQVADYAVSLGFLLNFAKTVPDGYSTADVVQKIIVPETKERACRYVSLPSVPGAEVGPAKYFISHRWAANFVSELVTLVAQHFADSADVTNGIGPAVASVRPSLAGIAERPLQGRSGASRGAVSADPAASRSGFEETVTDRYASADGSRGGGNEVGPRTPSLPSAQRSEPQVLPSQILRHALMQTQPGDSARNALGCPSNGGGPTSERWRAQQGPEARPPPGPGPPHCSSLGREPRMGQPAGLPTSGCGTGPGTACLSGSSNHQHGQASPVVSRTFLRAKTVREAPRRVSGGGGGGPGSGVFGRTISSCGAAAGLREDDVTSMSYSQRTVAAAAAAALAATLLPGATAAASLSAAAAIEDALDAAAGAANDSFSGSLNPLLARPSVVKHQWPAQQFQSMCSRHSVCSVSSAGIVGPSGGSFSRQGPSALLQPVPAAPGAAAALEQDPSRRGWRRDSAAGSRGGAEGTGLERYAAQSMLSGASAVGSALALPSTASLTDPDDGGAGGGGRILGATMTSSYSVRHFPPRLPSGREQQAAGRGTSANGSRLGPLYGDGAAATAAGGGGVGVCSSAIASAGGGGDRISEASDAAAGDPASAIRGRASSSITTTTTSRRSFHSSKWGSGARGSSTGAPGAAPTNAALVEGLRERFAGREALLQSTFVWLDIFAINQHPGSEQADDLAQLQDVVARSQETLLVLDRTGMVLTRIWCLYEIWQTVRRKGAEALRVLAGPLEYAELARVWGELEVERAEATVPADRDRILADIRATTGSEQLNRHIQQALVKSTCLDLETARTAAPRTPHHGERAYRAAFLHRTAGSAAAALAAAREASDVFCGCLGPADPRTLTALQTVAGCHTDLGAVRQALGLLELQVIPFLEEAYGPGNTESQALDELGMLYNKLGQYDMAYDLLLAALCLRLRALQAAAPTAFAASQLTAAMAAEPCAAALEAAAAAGRSAGHITGGTGGGDGGGRVVPPLEPLSGDHLAAVLAAVRALVSELAAAEAKAAARQTAAAPLSPGGGADGYVPLRCPARSAVELVGLSLHCLGMVQRERAQRHRAAGSSALQREARELMEASVVLLELSSTEARGLTRLDARANLAGLLMDGGDFEAAEQLLRRNLALTERVYGRDHPHTATAANNLALCLKRQRGVSPDKGLEAVALYRRCLDVCSGALGEAHPETLVVATNLGVLLADLRQWSESERLLTRAVAALPPQLGESHPDVLAAYRRLAEVLELRHKLFEAEAMFRITLQLLETAPAECRDHGLVLECREGLQRVQALMEAATRAQGTPGCCTIS